MLSLKQYTRRSTMMLLGALGLSMVVLFLLLRADLLGKARVAQQQGLHYQAESLAQNILYYRAIVEGLSARSEVVSLLAEAQGDEALDWALRMQPLLPGSVGLALFDEKGTLLGDPLRLRLGKLCRRDMHSYLSGDVLPAPRVHRLKGLEHFDLVAPVARPAGRLGVVFASFGLAQMQQALERIVTPGQALTLLAYDRSVIARTGQSADPSWEYRAPVPGTDWTLVAQMPPPALDKMVVYFLVAFGILAAVLALVLAVTTRGLGRLFLAEMQTVHRLVRELEKDNPGLDLKPRLRETEQLFDAIRGLAENIAVQHRRLRQQSTTDELTGLYNRRALEPACAELLDFVKSGGEGCLVIVDIDHFKEANDMFGHAVGDEVLKCLSGALAAGGYEDPCIRLGGDEFVVLLRAFDATDMTRWFQSLSERFRGNLVAARVPAADRCTLSAGAAVLSPDMDDCSSALRRADEALYQAKKGGRNRVVVDLGSRAG